MTKSDSKRFRSAAASTRRRTFTAAHCGRGTRPGAARACSLPRSGFPASAAARTAACHDGGQAQGEEQVLGTGAGGSARIAMRGAAPVLASGPGQGQVLAPGQGQGQAQPLADSQASPQGGPQEPRADAGVKTAAAAELEEGSEADAAAAEAAAVQGLSPEERSAAGVPLLREEQAPRTRDQRGGPGKFLAGPAYSQQQPRPSPREVPPQAPVLPAPAGGNPEPVQQTVPSTVNERMVGEYLRAF